MPAWPPNYGKCEMSRASHRRPWQDAFTTLLSVLTLCRAHFLRLWTQDHTLTRPLRLYCRAHTVRLKLFKKFNIPSLRADLTALGEDAGAQLVINVMLEDTVKPMGPRAVQQQIIGIQQETTLVR